MEAKHQIDLTSRNRRLIGPVQGSAKRWAPGLVNFVSAVAYHFCLGLPAAFTQPGARLLQKPFTQKPHDGGSHGES